MYAVPLSGLTDVARIILGSLGDLEHTHSIVIARSRHKLRWEWKKTNITIVWLKHKVYLINMKLPILNPVYYLMHCSAQTTSNGVILLILHLLGRGRESKHWIDLSHFAQSTYYSHRCENLHRMGEVSLFTATLCPLMGGSVICRTGNESCLRSSCIYSYFWSEYCYTFTD